MYEEGSSIAAATEDADHYVAQLAKQVGANYVLNKKALIEIMTRHHCFPNEHRVIIWRYLFRLPMNEEAYALYAQQPIHPSVKKLPNTLPIRYSVISNRLMRLLSALTYWHPPLAECDWLPGLVFPFLRLFERDSIVLFEVTMTIISNWCTEWLTFIPNPPITVLSRIDRICKAEGGSAPLAVSWPALRSLFAEVATTDAALILFDNILAARPVFLEYLVASFSLIKGEKVIDERNVHTIIERARRLYAKDSIKNPNNSSFVPLPRGFYPVLNIVEKVPKWREKEVTRIKREAEAAKQQEELNDELEKESIRIERKRKNWMAERAVLREIEEEQMMEFRRRERELLIKENYQEEISQQIRRERLRNRRIEEENAINEWKRDCERVQNEIREVMDTRKKTWTNWIHTKEEAAKIAEDEIKLELDLLKQRDISHAREIEQHNRLLEKAAEEETEIMNRAMKRNAELVSQRAAMKRELEEARRNQIQTFYRRKNSSKK
ncbi:hypothetical protein M9Y10_038240 [Tritrichomonas musculus]|uniref:Rab-GAP TBC domain-containing protein n=1 Tax=Tritrichomonas musculus TaxID=1915356 RepID=A0ABR2K8F4_9EUKA